MSSLIAKMASVLPNIVVGDTFDILEATEITIAGDLTAKFMHL